MGVSQLVTILGIGFVRRGEYLRALRFIRRAKQFFGERRAFLTVEGIIYLRLSRISHAQTHWREYWNRAKRDKVFSCAEVKLPIGNLTGNSRFLTTSPCGDSETLTNIVGRVCIYTALFGNDAEFIEPLYVPPGIDQVIFSDQPRETFQWKLHLVSPTDGNSALYNNAIKFLPHEYLNKYDYTLYVDPNLVIVGDLFLLLKKWLLNKSFVVWNVHPNCCDIYEYCETILTELVHEPDSIIDEYKYFLQKQAPKHTGLVETCFMWRDHRNNGVRKLMEEWWRHEQLFPGRDLAGLSHLMWKRDVRPEIMPVYLGAGSQNEIYFRLSNGLKAKESKFALFGEEPGAKRGEYRAAATRNKPPCKRTSRRGATGRSLIWLYNEDHKGAGSTIMRCFQLSELARQAVGETIEVRCVSERQLGLLRDSMLILTKGFLQKTSVNEVNMLKEAGNVICVDYVDIALRHELYGMVDLLIASSIKQFLHYSISYPDKVTHLITHHVDPRIEGAGGPLEYCKIGYFGELRNTRYRRQLRNMVDFWHVNTKSGNADTSWFPRLQQYNVHYAVRRTRSSDEFKPFLKGFVAAKCHANIIVQLDESDAVYYLGSDYPFVLRNESVRAVSEMICFAKDCFGGREWREGLEIMRSVRNRSAPPQIILELRELLTKCA